MRDDGVGYGNYLEQITYILFLKIVDELNKPPYSKNIQLPHIKESDGNEITNGEFCDWESLRSKNGTELESFYAQLLRTLS